MVRAVSWLCFLGKGHDSDVFPPILCLLGISARQLQLENWKSFICDSQEFQWGLWVPALLNAFPASAEEATGLPLHFVIVWATLVDFQRSAILTWPAGWWCRFSIILGLNLLIFDLKCCISLHNAPVLFSDAAPVWVLHTSIWQWSGLPISFTMLRITLSRMRFGFFVLNNW